MAVEAAARRIVEPGQSGALSFAHLAARGLAACLALVLGACASAAETTPARTATEQLLVTRAADAAAADFAMALPPGAAVFLEVSNARGEGADYAASGLREAVLRSGARIAPGRAQADVVVEVRLGALSIDKMHRVMGIPRLTVPVSPAFTTVTVPELSAYSRTVRKGVAEYNLFAYEAATGRPIALGGRMGGAARIRSHTLFMIFSWGERELQPQESRAASMARPAP